MATTPIPTPEPTPQPRGPITCPSCESRYNPETRELVQDTKLRERISELEREAVILRRSLEEKTILLDTANATIAQLEATPPDPTPEPRGRKSRDFIVGER